MADSFLSISKIAGNESMNERMNAAVSQQQHLGTVTVVAHNYLPSAAALIWVQENRYVWASSPDWAAAWDSALASHPDDSDYDPGADQAVITDGMILAAVQDILGSTTQEAEQEQAQS